MFIFLLNSKAIIPNINCHNLVGIIKKAVLAEISLTNIYDRSEVDMRINLLNCVLKILHIIGY